MVILDFDKPSGCFNCPLEFTHHNIEYSDEPEYYDVCCLLGRDYSEEKCPLIQIDNQELISLIHENRDIAKEPVKYTEPRFGMGYEYYDWKCPNCSKFLAYEPNIEGIPNRCQNCGQLLKKPKR